MLTQIRESFLGWKAVVVLVVLAASFVFFGVNMSFSDGGYVAKVDGVEIKPFEVQQLYNAQANQYRQQLGTLPPEIDVQLQQRALNDVITSTVVRSYLNKEGYAATDEQIAESIRQIPAFQEDEKFSSQQYRALLATQGITPQRFEADQRDNLRIQQLRAGLVDTAFITPAELRQYIEIVNETRTVEYGVIPLETYLPDANPEEAEVLAYYDANADDYQTVDSANIDYIELNNAAVEAGIEVNDEILQSYFETVSESFTTPEERNPRHILIPVDDDEEAASQQADAIYARVEAGEDFAELAETFSKDGGSASRGGDLGWVRQGQFVGSVDEAVFAMAEGELRGPIKSEFGFHIVRLDAIRPGGVPALADVRFEVEQQYRAEQAANQFFLVSNELSDALFDGPELEQLAESQGLSVQSMPEFTRDTGAIFANNEQVLDAIFGENAIRDGALSDPIDVAEDRIVVLRVNDFKPASVRPLDEVRNDIIAAIRRDQALAAREEAVSQLIANQRSAPDGDFAQAVTARAGTHNEAITVDRRSDAVPGTVLVEVFDARKPIPGAPSLGTARAPGDALYVFRVREVAAGNPGDLSEQERNALRTSLALQHGETLLAAFVSELRDTAKIKVGGAVIAQDQGF